MRVFREGSKLEVKARVWQPPRLENRDFRPPAAVVHERDVGGRTVHGLFLNVIKALQTIITLGLLLNRIKIELKQKWTSELK